VKIAPPLIIGGSLPGGSLFQAKVGGTCTGSSGVTSVKGNLTGRFATNDCLALAPPNVFPAATFGPVKWKGAGKYTGSTTNFTAGGTSTVTDPITLSVPGGGSSTITSGSFAGQHPVITIVVNEPVSTFISACGPKTKGVKPSGGLKKMTFGGASSLVIAG
jgi:hypothetical protein